MRGPGKENAGPAFQPGRTRAQYGEAVGSGAGHVDVGLPLRGQETDETPKKLSADHNQDLVQQAVWEITDDRLASMNRDNVTDKREGKAKRC